MLRYTCTPIEVSPEQMGWPVRRPRRYTLLVRNDHILRAGADEFFRIFGLRCAMPGVGLCAGSEADVKEYIAKMAEAKMVVPRRGEEPDVGRLLTPAQRRRLEEQIAASKGVEAFVGDVQQEVDWTTIGSSVPVLLRGSLLWLHDSAAGKPLALMTVLWSHFCVASTAVFWLR